MENSSQTFAIDKTALVRETGIKIISTSKRTSSTSTNFSTTRNQNRRQTLSQHDSGIINDAFSTAFSNVTMTETQRQREVVAQAKVNAEIRNNIKNNEREEGKWEMQRQLDPGVSHSVQPVGFRCYVPGCTINNHKPNHRCHQNGCSHMVHNLCCQRFGLNGDNELEMYCSFQCKDANMSRSE